MDYQDALALIKPSKKEEQAVLQAANALIEELKERIPQATIILGGSVGKGTWLTQTEDVDIFVAFPDEEVSLSDTLETAISDLSPERVHGSRDYFQITREGRVFEIVPIVLITTPDHAKNITDISPLHTKWVNDHADDTLKDEIRLTKAFFKANRLYGAESFIRGFSGYVLEVLTIHYGSFEKLIKAAKKWKEKDVIDPEKHHKDVFFEVNSSKLISPIIVIDPVQAGRNAAAALALKRFTACQDVANSFLKKPALTFFEKTPINTEDLKKQGALVVEVVPLEGKRDVVGCQVEKIFSHLAYELQNQEFVITFADFMVDEKAILYFFLEEKTLPEEQIKQGPPADFEAHTATFKKLYGDAVFEEEGSLKATVKRTHIHAKDLLEQLKDETYISERCQSIRVV